MPAPVRALVYGTAGLAVEMLFSSTVASAAARRPVRRGPSTPWMGPLYALALPLFEPVHERVREYPWPARATAYATGLFVLEALSGAVFRRLTGRIPWDYRGLSRWAIGGGLIRLDYAPLWGALGLATERLHDRMVGSAGARQDVPRT